MPANPFLRREWRAPRLRARDAARIAREAFDVSGDAEDVGSHQDQNFRISGPAGTYVLKIANPAFGCEELDLQNQAMHHAAARLCGMVQVPLPDRDGQEISTFDHDGREYHARLLTYLSGVPLRAFGYLAPSVLRDAGRVAGQVAAALGTFTHPAADRVLAWDVQRLTDVVDAFAPYIRHPEHRGADRAHVRGGRVAPAERPRNRPASPGHPR